LKNIRDLDGQFMRGDHHQATYAIAALGTLAPVQVVDDGDGKSRRFPGTGLGNGQYILSIQDMRNGFVLYVRRAAKAQLSDAAADFGFYG
jgi:hypothetical protein